MSGTYDAAVDQLNEDAPSWLAARRQKGLEAWANASMPSAQDEDWKYVDLDFTLDEFRPAQGPSEPLPDDPYQAGLTDQIGHVDLDDAGNNTTISAGGLYSFTEQFALGFTVARDPDAVIYGVVGRYYFGN